MDKKHLALHGLAIKKHGTAEQVAQIMGLDTEETGALLQQAVASGRAAESGDKYMLQPAAQMALKSEYGRIYAGLREDEDFVAAYEDFERVNGELKALITDWQTIEVGGEQVANDHSDPDYDEKIIDRLGDLHERAETVLDRLAAGLPRVVNYKNALLVALEKAEDGDIQWVSDAKIDSYHTVWFELHEDLLRVMGREREE